MFGDELQNVFETFTEGYVKNLDEVSLFTKLEDSFIVLAKRKKYMNNKIKIIHGNQSIVEFTSETGWVDFSKGKNINKELGDLLFLIYSPKYKCFKITYLQIKNCKSSLSLDAFKGDLYQLELLRKRPLLTRFPNKIVPTSDFLRMAMIKSIGSYGVFYFDSKIKKYIMKYYPANLLKPFYKKGVTSERKIEYVDELVKKNKAKKIPAIHMNTTVGTSLWEDSQGCNSVSLFGEALINFKIGSPILKPQANSIIKGLQFSGHGEGLGEYLQYDTNDNIFGGLEPEISNDCHEFYEIYPSYHYEQNATYDVFPGDMNPNSLPTAILLIANE